MEELWGTGHEVCLENLGEQGIIYILNCIEICEQRRVQNSNECSKNMINTLKKNLCNQKIKENPLCHTDGHDGCLEMQI